MPCPKCPLSLQSMTANGIVLYGRHVSGARVEEIHLALDAAILQAAKE